MIFFDYGGSSADYIKRMVRQHQQNVLSMGMEALQQEKYDQAIEYMLKEYKKNQDSLCLRLIAQLTQETAQNWNADQWANAA